MRARRARSTVVTARRVATAATVVIVATAAAVAADPAVVADGVGRVTSARPARA